MELFAEMTQGDPYYDEIAFLDRYGAPMNLSGWDIEVTFRTSFAGSLLTDLTVENDGIGFLNDDETQGVIYLAFDADVVADLDIYPNPRNGDLVPFKTIIGDVKLTPPTGVELIQGEGARTTLFLKVKAGLT